MNETEQGSRAKLGLWDAIAIILGIIIGAGIYETPVGVFQKIGDPWLALGLWLVAGILVLIGALCYAELATAYPRSGGDYVYLTRAYGPLAGFLFGWAQLAVIQTGSIGLMAYIFADYGSGLYNLGDYSSVIYAAGAIVLMTVVNMLGVVLGKTAQNLLTFAKVVGLIAIVVAGFGFAGPKPNVTAGYVEKAENQQIVLKKDFDSAEQTFKITDKTQMLFDFKKKKTVKVDGKKEEVDVSLKDFQPKMVKQKDEEGKEFDKLQKTWVKVLSAKASPDEADQVFDASQGFPPYSLIASALVLVFLTYGGWNDAAFVAAEVRNRERNIPLALILGTAGVTIIYLLVNQAYISGLGFEGAQLSNEVAADVLKLLPWSYGEQAMRVLVMVSALAQ